MEDKKNTKEGEITKAQSVTNSKLVSDISTNENNQNKRSNSSGRGGRKAFNRNNRPKDDMEQRILEVARVTRVMAGGKRMSFRVCVAIGDRKGSVGVGLGKGADVTIAINKAVNRAKKTMFKVITVNDTIPHAVVRKMGASRIMLKPAKTGRGIIAGGVTRVILELSGIKNITSKMLGSKSKINNARCTIQALKSLRRPEASKDLFGDKESRKNSLSKAETNNKIKNKK